MQRQQILLIRHGLTDANAGGIIQGHRPTPLNAVGREQARRLAGRLEGSKPPIGVLISSDLPRAAQTAEPIASACRLPIVYDPAWRERCFGALEGTTAAEREIWRAAAGETDPPGAESAVDFTGRIRGALAELPKKHPQAGVVAVVTHGGPCRAILRMLIDGTLALASGASRPELAMIANCSIMHLAHIRAAGGDGWELARLNDVDHLGQLEATLRDAG